MISTRFFGTSHKSQLEPCYDPLNAFQLLVCLIFSSGKRNNVLNFIDERQLRSTESKLDQLLGINFGFAYI